MRISYCEKDRTFTLHTNLTTYQMVLHPLGYLLHAYYGEKVTDQDLSYRIQPRDRAFAANPPDAGGDRRVSTDTLPQEYAAFGNGDFRESCLDVCHADGSVFADLRYVSHEIYKGKKALPGLPAAYGSEDETETLEITLADQVSGVNVVLSYSVFPEFDVIARSAEIINRGARAVTLRRALSVCVDEPLPSDRDVITFYGRHMGERCVERTPVRHGKIRVESMRGASTLHYNPFVILCDRGASETDGNCEAYSFVYSGNFTAQIEKDQADTTRFVMGINPQNFSWELKPEESFRTPEVLCSFSASGLDLLSYNLHRFELRHLVRGKYKYERCPILVNNWEATYFSFDEAKLLRLAEAARDIGVEMLVLDDGWFGRRNDDTTSLGDWFVNTEKLPNGIGGFAEKIHKMGLKFGLWFEPEMINPVSRLMETHPEWCITIPGRALITSRSQCVLDMGLKAVQDYLYDAISAIIREAKLDYIKWDMNRSITNAHSIGLPAERQGEFWHRYILGVYALMERLLCENPDLLLESCSSGGGRYDAGMLFYSPQVWASDNTDAVDRLSIQYGNSFGFAMKTMGSHVSVCPNHQTGRTVPLETRAMIAMSGSYGYEMDLTQLDEEEKQLLRAENEKFKAQWEIHQLGRYHRLTNAQTDAWFTAWQVTARDQSRALVNVVVKQTKANAPVLSLKLRGLDPNAVYADGTGRTYTGAALTKAGLVLPPMSGNYPCLQVELVRQ